MGGGIPGLVTLVYTRKQAEQGMGRKPVGRVPLWPLQQFLPSLSLCPDFL